MKFILSTLLTLTTLFLSAQDPTYEQTVEFIKKNCVGRMLYEGPLDSYQRETGHKLTKVEIQKDGRIKLVADQQHGRHDFEIVFNIFDLKSSIDYPDGIRAYKFLVHFQGLNVTNAYGITFATDADAKRVARAFRHLKTKCSKSGSLFDEPTRTERRPTLTKEETIKYIEDLLAEQSDLSSYDNEIELKFTFDHGKLKIKKEALSNWENEYNFYESEYSFDLTDALIKDITLSIPDPNMESRTSCLLEVPFDFDKKYYVLKLKFDSYEGIEYKYKFRDSHARYMHKTERQARNECSSHPWQTRDESTSCIGIYIEKESDAKRLQKALQHLAALIKEEKQSEDANDPFGE